MTHPAVVDALAALGRSLAASGEALSLLAATVEVWDRPEPPVSIEEAAHRLGVSKTSVYEMVRSGVLPAVKVGAAWKVSGWTIAELLASGTQPPASLSLVDGGRSRKGST